MSRRPYIHLAGDQSLWPRGFAPQVSHFRALDQFSSELINGEEGGTWVPTEPLVLGGTIANALRLNTSGSVISGDVETVDGNELGTELETPGLILQSGAVPTFPTPRTRIINVGFTNAFHAVNGTPESEYHAVDPDSGALMIVGTPPSVMVFAAVIPIRGTHKGATISQVDFRFIAAGDPNAAAVPAATSSFAGRVLRCSSSAVAHFHSATANVPGGYSAAGWRWDTATTVADWLNNGQVRTHTYTPDQNHTNVDPESYFYMVQMRTAIGALAGTMFLSAAIHLTNIVDYRPE